MCALIRVEMERNRKGTGRGRTSSGVSFPVVANVDTFEVLLTAFEAETMKSKSFSLTESFGAVSSDMAAGGQRERVPC